MAWPASSTRCLIKTERCSAISQPPRSRSPRTLAVSRRDAQCQAKFEWPDPQVAACAAGDVSAPSAASGVLASMPGRNSSKKIRARSSRRLWVPVFSKIDLR